MATVPMSSRPAFLAIVNYLFLRKAGGPHRSRTIPSSRVFPAAAELEQIFPEIRDEVLALLRQRSIPAYGTFDPVRASQVSEDWRLFYAYMYGVRNELALTECPRLLRFAEETPNVVNVMISVLDPHVGLPSHKDPYAGILRYHLAVSVPRDRAPRIRLDDEWYSWKAGEGVVLDVAFEHEVVNEADEPRVVVIVDFRRPMGPVADLLNRYCLGLKRKRAPEFVDAAKYDVMHA